MCSADQSGGWFEKGRCALSIRVEVGLRREGVLCRSEWSVGFDQIAIRLK